MSSIVSFRVSVIRTYTKDMFTILKRNPKSRGFLTFLYYIFLDTYIKHGILRKPEEHSLSLYERVIVREGLSNTINYTPLCTN